MSGHKVGRCPSWLPSRWVVSKGGKAHAYIVVTDQHALNGERLLRLRFLADDVTGPPCWTVSSLREAGSRFLKNKPRAPR